MENYPKKSYKLFIAWIAFFIAADLTADILAADVFKLSDDVVMKIVMLVVIICLDVLLLIIYFGGYVYWINGGPDYEKAKEAGREKRRIYALKHLTPFLKITCVYAVYFVFGVIFSSPVVVDILVAGLLIFGAAISTIKIKFD